jgi:hypothetical protein
MVRLEGNMSLKNPVTQPGIDPRTVRLVAQRLNHYATPGTTYILYRLQKHKEIDQLKYLEGKMILKCVKEIT